MYYLESCRHNLDYLDPRLHNVNAILLTKIQQTKMLVTCQRFGDLFLSGLVWQYFPIRTNIIKVGSKSWLLKL